MVRSLNQQIDQRLLIQPGSMLLVGGSEDLIEMFVLGILSTVERAQWVNVGVRPFIPPTSNVDVINWGPDPKAEIPTEGMVVFVDGFKDSKVDVLWNKIAKEFLKVATECRVTVIVLFQMDESNTMTDPKEFMPNDMVSELRKSCSHEMVFGRRYHKSMATIRSLDDVGQVLEEKVFSLYGADNASL